jgi:hypothetical protein
VRHCSTRPARRGLPRGWCTRTGRLWLHAMNLRTPDSFGIRNGHSFLCAVPVFHVLSWGVPDRGVHGGHTAGVPGRCGRSRPPGPRHRRLHAPHGARRSQCLDAACRALPAHTAGEDEPAGDHLRGRTRSPGPDRRLGGTLRRRHGPRLGYDRDGPGRHGRADPCRCRRRRAPPLPGQPGAVSGRHGVPRRRGRRDPAAAQRPVEWGDPGARQLGDGRLPPLAGLGGRRGRHACLPWCRRRRRRRRRRALHHRTVGCAPGTSGRSRATASSPCTTGRPTRSAPGASGSTRRSWRTSSWSRRWSPKPR